MLRTKVGAGIAVAAALVFGAGLALAASGWTIVSMPPTGENAPVLGVSAVSGTDAWAVGFHSGNAGTNVGAKALIDNWNGTAWSAASAPTTPGNTALLTAVSGSSATDAWAVGRTQVNKSDFEGLALHWNGTAWSVPSGFSAALSGISGASAANDVWAVGVTQPTGATQGQTLTLNWNGTAWTTVASPDAGSPSVLNAVSASPGAGTVWAVGESGVSGSFNPLAMETSG